MNLNKVTNYLSKFIYDPKVCIMLGSGLDNFTEIISNKITIPYTDIPSFYQTSVEGHKGEFIFGNINNVPVLCAKGRFHYYEGYTFKEVGSIIEIFNFFKPKLSIITNSSGCLNINWKIGSLMISNKIIDFSFINSSDVQTHLFKKNKYFDLAKDIALNNNINLNEGAYTYTIGPSYETYPEIKEIISLGGSAVGMSTFPEYLMCKKLDLNFIIISCLTNYGAGIQKNKVTHDEVLENADKSKKIFSLYLTKIIENIERPRKLKNK